MYTPGYLVDETCFKTLPLSDKHKVLLPTLCREPINMHTDRDLVTFNLIY